MKSYWAKVAGLAVVYYVSGRLGLLLVVPPGHSTAMWPPAGIALAGMLILGPGLWPGVFLGALCLSLFVTSNAAGVTGMTVAAIIAAGASLQAVASSWLCRRWVVLPNSLETARDIGLLLVLGGPLGCLISATIGAGALLVGGLIPLSGAWVGWLTWWSGDTLGVLVFMPVILLMHESSTDVTRRRRLAVAATLVVALTVTVVLFFVACHWEYERQGLEFEKETTIIVSDLGELLRNDGDAVSAAGLLFDASDEVSATEFKTFAQGIMDRHPGIRGLTWVRKVTDAERPDFEAARRRDSHSEFSISDRDTAHHLAPAPTRGIYYPVTYTEPRVRELLGFDENSDALRRQTLERAIESGQREATPRLELHQIDPGRYGLLIFRPVFTHGKPLDTPEDRRANLQGFIVGATVLPELIGPSLAGIKNRDVDVYITDNQAPPGKELLYDSRTPDNKESASAPTMPPEIRQWQRQIQVSGRTWTIHCIQGHAAWQTLGKWSLWGALAGGLLFTALATVFAMVLTARTDTVRRLVAARTRQIRESEYRHQQLIDGAYDYAIYSLDPRGHVDSWSTGAERVKGYRSAEIVGQHFSRFYTQPDRDNEVPADDLRVALKEGHLEAEGWRERKDGSLFWASVTMAPLRDRLGRHTGYVKVTRDFTERKRIDEAIRASEETFRLAMEHASIGMALVNTDGEWLQVNNALSVLLGYDRSELLARTHQTVSHPEDRARDMESIRQMLAGEIQTYQLEKRYLHKNGHVVWVLLNVSLVRHADGSPQYFVVQMQDVSARKHMDRMKSEFIATVSHELRTPLTSIRGSLGLISGGATGQLPEKAARLVDVAYQNTARLTLIINDILDVEKIESGKMSLSLSVQALTPLLQQAVEENRGYAQTCSVRLHLQKPLPEVMVNVDASRLLQVLANFLSNAAKFSPSGGAVEIGASLNGATVRVFVSDHGAGIPTAFQPLIFQRFCQADGSDTRAKGGTGLGLNIAKSLVETMKGSIGYTTQVGVGTTFFFDLPVCPALDAACSS
jgi:PAS domain S-box-containing protein